MNPVKMLCGLLCLLVVASNVWSMSRWSETRGVYDDVCYLRQAHLFQRFGLSGFDTDVARDDDHFLAEKLKAIGYPDWNDGSKAPCHVPMQATGKQVVQYPPGTGLMLALFPEGRQVVSLYIAMTVVIFGFALLAVSYARSTPAILGAGLFGCLAVYMMINPAKASYSVAPTMAACALGGWLTAMLFAGSRHRILLTLLTGLVIGISVNFRLPNLLLSAGYCLFFLAAFLRARNRETLLEGAAFAVAFVIGMAPTLWSNAINAGSPFRTTYSAIDATPPAFSASVIWQYIGDLQFALIVLAVGWAIWILRTSRNGGARQVVWIVVANLAVNLGFFLTHPIVTPYYTIPIAMLSLWSLLFGSLPTPAEAVGVDAPEGRERGDGPPRAQMLSRASP